MEHEHIESVEHENHEAVEKAERERGEDMADEAEHEEQNYTGFQDFMRSLHELQVRIFDLQHEAEETLENYQSAYEKVILELIKEQPEKYGPHGSDRNWLESEMERLGFDVDLIRGFDTGNGPRGSNE